MLLGSGEHYGWELPRTAELVAVLAGQRHDEEFAWIRVPEGAEGGPLDVMARPRLGDGRWRTPGPQERVNVAAWTLADDEAAALEQRMEDGVDLAWEPPKPLPDLWLWVRG